MPTPTDEVPMPEDEWGEYEAEQADRPRSRPWERLCVDIEAQNFGGVTMADIHRATKVLRKRMPLAMQQTRERMAEFQRVVARTTFQAQATQHALQQLGIALSSQPVERVLSLKVCSK